MNLGFSIAGLALLSVSGASITVSLLYCKRLQDSGVGADAVTAARYIVLIVLAGAVVFWRGETGIATSHAFVTLSVATTTLIVLPLFAFQLGIGRTTPLTAQVIRALGPVFVFALEQFDDRTHYSLPTLLCTLAYSASVIVSNIAHGWSEDRERSHPVGQPALKPAQAR
jgi:drug/metabolite transporter (DMT)-like permease